MEFSQLFTHSAQQVLPLARTKGLVSFFDYRGSNIELATNADPIRAAMHRLMLTLTESIDQGFLTLTAEAVMLDADHCAVTVTAAGTGLFVTDQALEEVLKRHGAGGIGMTGLDDVHAQWREPLHTQPAIEVALSLHKARSEGLSFTWQAVLPARLINEPLPAQAHGATAWLVNAIPGGLDSVKYRLRRQGWHVTLLQSLQDAQALLDAGPPANRPLLLLVAESPQAMLADLERLTRLSPATWLVLAVDDHPVNQLVVRGLLELLGCEVDIAADGEQAIAFCRARAPDLVLMDVHMPGLNGLEATRQLRTLQRQGVVRPFPIVAATAMHSVQGRQECLAAGMDGYLEKPLELQALKNELHRVLPMQPLLPNGRPEP
ncbi:response regulator [Azohydromonas lata]|uniref:Response regulator n=1 Tax=Azohydromonas lata TaxID=45677 RepID=A0ABU5ICH8_9BURK|nr:response regulator [Azohydromonas lata]MDZ5456822.1 response regulator [Azohydromonas lata]